jgi:hypothetical protein
MIVQDVGTSMNPDGAKVKKFNFASQRVNDAKFWGPITICGWRSPPAGDFA